MLEMSKFGKPTQVTAMKIKELKHKHVFFSPARPGFAAGAGGEGVEGGAAVSGTGNSGGGCRVFS